jgi:monomeric isocitrate dehydrogenase
MMSANWSQVAKASGAYAPCTIGTIRSVGLLNPDASEAGQFQPRASEVNSRNRAE